MTDAGIIGAARTPIGGEAGRTLTRIHPVDLHAHVIRSLIERTGVSPRPRTVRGRGDTPVRSISDLMTCAWRSTGWILVRVRPASPPMGVRAAPMIPASVMATSPACLPTFAGALLK